jgi:hypothetical protein
MGMGVLFSFCTGNRLSGTGFEDASSTSQALCPDGKNMVDCLEI